MTKTVIEMAREAGFSGHSPDHVFVDPACLERFAALVREDEREKQQRKAALDELSAIGQELNLDNEPVAIGAYEVVNEAGNEWELVYPEAIHKYKMIPEHRITQTFYTTPPTAALAVKGTDVNSNTQNPFGGSAGAETPEEANPQQVEALHTVHRHDCGGNIFDCAGCEAAWHRQQATGKQSLQVQSDIVEDIADAIVDDHIALMNENAALRQQAALAARQMRDAAVKFIHETDICGDAVMDEIEEAITALREALAEQAEQEPVATVVQSRPDTAVIDVHTGNAPLQLGTLLYATPVRTKDLTDDEIAKITGHRKVGGTWPVAVLVGLSLVAADREKNK